MRGPRKQSLLASGMNRTPTGSTETLRVVRARKFCPATGLLERPDV
jgi:hypothetical protein